MEVKLSAKQTVATKDYLRLSRKLLLMTENCQVVISLVMLLGMGVLLIVEGRFVSFSYIDAECPAEKNR